MDFLTQADTEKLGGAINHLVIGLCRLEKRADGTVPSFEEVRELVEERLGRSPRFRQFPYVPPNHGGLPVWADAQDFDLDYHVVEAETEGPVDRHQLDELLAEPETTFFAPLHLPKLVHEVATNGPPAEPWQIMQRSTPHA